MNKKALRYLKKVDPSISEIIKQAGPCTLKPQLKKSPFHSLAESIAYQQLTGKAAKTIWNRVLALYGGKQPTPDQVIKTDSRKLRAAGLSKAKVLALKDLAKKAKSGLVPPRAKAHKLTDQELIDRLTQVRGIGQWTVEMFLIFTLGREDIFPAADYGVQKGYAHVYNNGEMLKAKELLKLSEQWKPYRTYAAWYLWRAVDLASYRSQKK